MEGTLSGSGTKTTDLEAMMEELGLKEDDLQDVVVEDEEIPEEATRWMAIARVHTEKTYSQYWFFRNMGSGEGSENQTIGR